MEASTAWRGKGGKGWGREDHGWTGKEREGQNGQYVVTSPERRDGERVDRFPRRRRKRANSFRSKSNAIISLCVIRLSEREVLSTGHESVLCPRSGEGKAAMHETPEGPTINPVDKILLLETLWERR